MSTPTVRHGGARPGAPGSRNVPRSARVRRAVAASAACLLGASLGVVPVQAVSATTSAPATTASTPLAHLVLQGSIAGYAVSQDPGLDGPLTQATLVSLVQNARTSTVLHQIDQLSQKQGFSSFVRVWSDAGGQVGAANEIEIALLQLPSAGQVGNLLFNLDPTSGEHSPAVTFTVPSVPGAKGETFTTTDPHLGSIEGEYGTSADLDFDRTIQIAWFSTGRYVCMVKILSDVRPTNPSPPTSAVAAHLALDEYHLLASSPLGRTFDTLLAVRIGLGAVALALVAFLVLHRRRREVMRLHLLASLGHTGDLPADGRRQKRWVPPVPEGPDVAPIGPDPHALAARRNQAAAAAAAAAGGAAVGAAVGVGTLLGEAEQAPPSVTDLLGTFGGRPAPGRPAGGSQAARGAGAVGVGAGSAGVTTTGGSGEAPSAPAAPSRQVAAAASPGIEELPRPAQGTPAGWLPDPAGADRQLRYWDGLDWTRHVAVPKS